ncbi:MAG: hypothetical protein AAGL49_00240 [Pseudomonadota bacterium]
MRRFRFSISGACAYSDADADANSDTYSDAHSDADTYANSDGGHRLGAE